VQRILREAGFTSIALEPVDLTLDIAMGRGLDAAVNAAMMIGPVSRALEGQPPEACEAAARSIRAALASLQKDGSVLLGASVWVVAARSA
jgi:hypothetical protein